MGLKAVELARDHASNAESGGNTNDDADSDEQHALAHDHSHHVSGGRTERQPDTDSFVLRVTLNDMIPNNPIDASTSARIPKTLQATAHPRSAFCVSPAPAPES